MSLPPAMQLISEICHRVQGPRIGRIDMRLTGKGLSATSDIKEKGLGIVVVGERKKLVEAEEVRPDTGHPRNRDRVKSIIHGRGARFKA